MLLLLSFFKTLPYNRSNSWNICFWQWNVSNIVPCVLYFSLFYLDFLFASPYCLFEEFWHTRNIFCLFPKIVLWQLYFRFLYIFPLLNDNRESHIDLETSIVPLAILEIGIIETELGNFTVAKEYLDHVLKDFSGYMAENFVHLKVYASIRLMGIKTDKQKDDKEKCKCSKWKMFPRRSVRSRHFHLVGVTTVIQQKCRSYQGPF